jgi:benzodiazapine receptor
MSNVGRRVGRVVLGIALLLLPLGLSFAVYPMRRGDGTKEWLAAMQQSPLTPPPYVFGVVWTLLYLLLGIVLALLVDSALGSSSVLGSGAFGPVCFFVSGLLLYAAQLAANYAYLHVMFVQRDIHRALRVLYAMLALAAVTVLVVAPTSALAAALLCPYAAYLFYAYRLQAYLVENNAPATLTATLGQGQNVGQNEGQNVGRNVGQNEGQNDQNEGQG